MRIGQCTLGPRLRAAVVVIHMELRHERGVVACLAGINHLARNGNCLRAGQILHAVYVKEILIHQLRHLLVVGDDGALA